jgi:hypothetical protein
MIHNFRVTDLDQIEAVNRLMNLPDLRGIGMGRRDSGQRFDTDEERKVFDQARWCDDASGFMRDRQREWRPILDLSNAG